MNEQICTPGKEEECVTNTIEVRLFLDGHDNHDHDNHHEVQDDDGHEGDQFKSVSPII